MTQLLPILPTLLGVLVVIKPIATIDRQGYRRKSLDQLNPHDLAPRTNFLIFLCNMRYAVLIQVVEQYKHLSYQLTQHQYSQTILSKCLM